MVEFLPSKKKTAVRFRSPAQLSKLYFFDKTKILGDIHTEDFCLWITDGYLTASLRPLPALNLGTLLAAILMLAPVCGFLPTLAALLETVKVPKPVKTTSLPIFKFLVISSITAPNAVSAHFLVHSVALTIEAIKSSLVIFAIIIF